MRERIQDRINELQAELDTGSQRMQELEREQTQLREVMLRISGALQVLHELLESDGGQNGATATHAGRATSEEELEPALNETPSPASSHTRGSA